MTETLSGEGTLRGAQLEAQWTVTYHFVITTRVVERSGLPPVPGRSSSSGTVTALRGETIPEGYYELSSSDRESIRVKNLGMGQWVILNPMA